MDKREAKRILELHLKIRRGHISTPEIIDPRDLSTALEIAIKSLV